MGAGFGMTYGLYLLGRRYPRLAFWLGLCSALFFLAASLLFVVSAVRKWDPYQVVFAGLFGFAGIMLIYNVWPLRQRIRRERELRSLRAR